MKKGRYKLYLILSLVIAFGSLAAVVAAGWAPRQGLDLSGGISIILRAEGEGADNPEILDKTVSIIRDRIDQLGVADAEVSRAGTSNILVQLPGLENENEALELIGTTAQLTFRQVKEVIPPTAKKKPEVTELKDSSVNDEEVVYPSGQPGEQGVFYRLEPARLTGEIITRAEAVVDPTTGANWSVSLDMNDEGSQEWAAFTKELACLRDQGEEIKSQVAIVLDGQVESAAGMQTPTGAAGEGVTCEEGITGGQTSITVGGKTEAQNLALVLKTGALPITLEQDQVQKVSPTLGRDSLNAGYLAGAIGLGLVMLYMLIYYRALALVVWLGLAVFAAITYVTLAILGETAGLSLSLAGIAGIIVSVGVTADSYIVAFERVKDEAHTGKTVRAAVSKGMERAFKTILVADTVTGAAAIILFFLAVGPVRGFALTLGIATVIDVLVAYFFTRSAVNLLANTKWVAGDRFFGMRRALGVTG
ncbi:MAG: protein translocase subunit SecD [Actinobacteria bacterium]|nr:protein translocase subunit SecD [Actinomycetota bacterium]